MNLISRPLCASAVCAREIHREQMSREERRFFLFRCVKRKKILRSRSFDLSRGVDSFIVSRADGINMGCPIGSDGAGAEILINWK